MKKHKNSTFFISLQKKSMRYLISTLFLLSFIIANAQYSKDITIEKVLKTDTTTIGQKIVYPNTENSEVTILKITIKPGQSTGWHHHQIPVFAYVQSGTLTVELENGKSIIYPPNSSFAEMTNTQHNGTNKGTDDLVLIAFFVGIKGEPLSIH